MRTARDFVDELIAKVGVPLTCRGALIAAVERRDFDWSQWMVDALRDQKRMTEEMARQDAECAREL